jgi:hypothetical protein
MGRDCDRRRVVRDMRRRRRGDVRGGAVTTILRVVCDRCQRVASVGPGAAPEDLAACGWSVVRDLAICPVCTNARPARGEPLRLSREWTPGQIARTRRGALVHRLRAEAREALPHVRTHEVRTHEVRTHEVRRP